MPSMSNVIGNMQQNINNASLIINLRKHSLILKYPRSSQELIHERS